MHLEVLNRLGDGMRLIKLIIIAVFSVGILSTVVLLVPEVRAESETVDLLDDEFYNEDYLDDESGEGSLGGVIWDPFEPLNRVFFVINDKIYFWVLKPAKIGYSAVVPYDLRFMLGNFFYNIASPVRFINNLLQGDFVDAGVVLSRFTINSTAGIFGFGDPAGREYGLKPRQADLGETLGKWGVGDSVYLCWPVLGPSNIRDSVGLLGDIYIHPMYYSGRGNLENLAYYAGTRINLMSLKPSVYEEMKQFSLDPYVATRQAYYDYRRNIIEKDAGTE